VVVVDVSVAQRVHELARLQTFKKFLKRFSF
jgi:hypothetical protein